MASGGSDGGVLRLCVRARVTVCLWLSGPAAAGVRAGGRVLDAYRLVGHAALSVESAITLRTLQ